MKYFYIEEQKKQNQIKIKKHRYFMIQRHLIDVEFRLKYFNNPVFHCKHKKTENT